MACSDWMIGVGRVGRHRWPVVWRIWGGAIQVDRRWSPDHGPPKTGSSAHAVDAGDFPPAGAGWIHEIKFDGYRFQLNVRSGRATWFTRNGHDWTEKLPLHSAAAALLEDCVLDGELCVEAVAILGAS